MKIAHSLVVTLLMLAACAGILGQTATTARITGLVTDAQGNALPGAVVQLVDVATNSERVVTTNEEGRYVFVSLSPGTYDLRVSANGFAKASISGIRAEVTKTVTTDVTLEVGALQEAVNVEANSALSLQREDASIGNVIDQDRLKRLPNLDRQATSFLALQPGAQPTGEITGARRDQNRISLDGVDVTDSINGFAFRSVIPVPTESVEEFRVTVANPNATFGGSTGAQVVLVTKRGTNQFHGSLYEYHQNAALNANSWTSNRLGLRRPPLVNNRFGGSIGGPIWRNHTFFFFNYEGRRRPGSELATRLVPTASLRAGQLRFRDLSGNVFTIDPRTFDPRNIGANPQILKALSVLPLPNNPSFGDGLNNSGFTANIPTTLQEDFAVLRIDQKIGQNWSIEAKGAAFRGISTNTSQVDIVNLLATSRSPDRPRNLNFALRGAVAPNLINEFRVGYTFDKTPTERISPTTIGGFNLPVDLASASLVADPTSQLDEPIDVDTQRARFTLSRGATTQFTDNVTWVKGAHTMQFGGSLHLIRTDNIRTDKLFGVLTTPVAQIGAGGNVFISASERPQTCDSSQGITQNCLRSGDLQRYNQYYATMLGIVDNVPVLAVRDASLQPLPLGTNLEASTKERLWEFYFSDVWRLKPSLTFTYGLTYQWRTPPVEKEGRQTLLTYSATGELVFPQEYIRLKREAAERGEIFNPVLAYTPIGDTGRDGILDINRKDFSPRISVAWQPSPKDGVFARIFGRQSTVLRGGYSILFDRPNRVMTTAVPLLGGVGFAQSLTLRGPRNSSGAPFRAGIDGPIPTPATFAVPSPYAPPKAGEVISLFLDPNLADPHHHTVDFTIQREIPGDMLLEVGYVGRFGRNLYQTGNLNSAPYFFKDKTSGQVFAQAFDAVALQLRGGVNPNSVTPQPWFENQLGAGATVLVATRGTGSFIVGNVSSLWQTVIDPLAPQPYNNNQVDDLDYRTSQGRSNYHGMLITLRKRHSRGLTFDFNYTLSKSLDQVGQWQNSISVFPSSYDPDTDYGPSFFDRRHTFNANWVFDLPSGHGHRFKTGNWMDKVIGGWSVAGVFQASSGLPLSVVQGTQVFGAGLRFGFSSGAIPTTNADFGNDIHNSVPGSGGIGISGDPARRGSGFNLFANPEEVFRSFRRIELSKDSRSGRGILRGLPGWNFDLSVGKEMKLGEQVKFRLSFEFFNVLNHVIFADPSLDLNDPTNFGVIRGTANQPRSIQLGGRFEF